MVSGSIHRLIEQQAAARADTFAYVDATQALTYRELNARANVVARALLAARFRRGDVADVHLHRSPELVATLLGILKAGGAYRWTPDGASPLVCGVDVARVLASHAQISPNLPIVTRGSEIACVMPDGVLVPHATVAAVARHAVPRDVEWSEGTGALDVWMALMTGATVSCTQAPATVAA